MNKPRWEGGGKRWSNKILNKKNWFKNRGEKGKEGKMKLGVWES